MRTLPVILALFIISAEAMALDVSYPFPPLRFSLSIGKDSLIYQSEGARRELHSAECNRPVIARFAGEFFHKLPRKKTAGELYVKVDKSKFEFKRGSDLFRYLENMDARIIRVLLDARKACK